MGSSTTQNLRLGLLVGAAMATLYSLYALGLFFLSGPETFEKYDTSFAVVVGSYYAAGVAGGVLIGGLLPLAKRLPGRILLGVIGGLVVFFCIGIAVSGPFWNWPRSEWKNVAELGVFMGGIAGAIWRKATGW